ncbi:MAG: hypothetical protein V3U34_00590 [candidate division NC10 bacterium]
MPMPDWADKLVDDICTHHLDYDSYLDDAATAQLIRERTVDREAYMQALKDLREAASLIIALNKQLDHGCQP